MKIELHILQNFSPSNLNRDDTGAPKDCDFGGVRRARISSQCLKRATREAFRLGEHFKPEEMATRTKRLVDVVSAQLEKVHGREPTEAQAATIATLEGSGLGIKAEKDNKTEYLLFLPKRVIAALAAFIHENWDVIRPLAAPAQGAEAEADGKKRKGKRDAKKDKQEGFPKELRNRLEEIVSSADRVPDLALFGRMIADHPDWNVDAASQVAHAVSTHRVAMDFDFYTAVDELRREDTEGSDMMGTIQFNSACFYRYAVLDREQLQSNLKADPELLRRTVEAFIRGSAEAIPTGKQNSMAAQNPPSYFLAVVREKGTPMSLANAFVRPVRASADEDLVEKSVAALEGYFGELTRLWGAQGVSAIACADRTAASATPQIERVDSFSAVVARTLVAAKLAEA
ncbi:MAG: type I-E CRISPR-associated protein Cas7/Cse4/CasC [Deltaproteobacteria bacterium]|nr:type I-E CRISPR-associated protein Cas7/Cse4/CasC [Deltaproteobacteria bacterium]